MRILFIAVVVAVLCWVGVSKWRSPAKPVEPVAAAPAPVKKPAPANLPPVAPPPQPAPSAPVVSPPPATASASARGAAAAPLAQITLDAVLGPDNSFYDAPMGISATYPVGWKVTDAERWGENNRENTVHLSTGAPGPGVSMYYQQYPKGYLQREEAPGWLQRVAQTKEASRIASSPDYKNVPNSFEFTEINGNPAMSYFAVFTRGGQTHTEYFVRVLGPTKYVMFSTSGPLEDVQKIMPQIKQMAGTVKVP